MHYNIIAPAHQSAGGEHDERILLDVEAVDEQDAWEHLMAQNNDVKAWKIQGVITYWWNDSRIKLEIRKMG